MSKPFKVEYKVSYAHRIYGWKMLSVTASSITDAIDQAIKYLGFKPESIQAYPELHPLSGLTADD